MSRRKSKYSHVWNNKELLTTAAQNSNSQQEMLRYLNVRVNTGNAATMRDICKKYNIMLPIYDPSKNGGLDYLHRFNRASADEVLSIGFQKRNAKLLKRCMQEKGCKIDLCWIPECNQGLLWLGKELTLQVDHINGNNLDNRLENLRILCPHCHTQTETYANNKREKRYNYCECGTRIDRQAVKCIPCDRTDKKQLSNEKWPPVEEIISLLQEVGSFRQVGFIIGFSDTGIRKYLSRNGIDIKNINFVRKNKID